MNESTMDELASELTTEEVEHLIASISLDDATVGDELCIDYWNSKRSRCPKKARGLPPSFPHVLKRLLNTKYPSIMWTHDGTGIIITSDKLPKVLSNYFKTNKIESFLKQLNLYGFKNIAGVYMHPLFNRDSKSVRSLITTFHNKKHMKLANKA